MSAEIILRYSPTQPRDSHGRWTSTGGGVLTVDEAHTAIYEDLYAQYGATGEAQTNMSAHRLAEQMLADDPDAARHAYAMIAEEHNQWGYTNANRASYDDVAHRPLGLLTAAQQDHPESTVFSFYVDGEGNLAIRHTRQGHTDDALLRMGEIPVRPGDDLKRAADLAYLGQANANVIESWGQNANSGWALQMQYAAANSGWRGLSDSELERLSGKGEGWLEELGIYARDNRAQWSYEGQLFSAQRALTQKVLADKGITGIKAYRGFRTTEDVGAGENLILDSRPLSSWSLDRQVAENFAGDTIFDFNEGAEHAYVAEAVIPAENVYSIGGMGLGFAQLSEIVVLNSDDNVGKLVRHGEEEKIAAALTPNVKRVTISASSHNWTQEIMAARVAKAIVDDPQLVKNLLSGMYDHLLDRPDVAEAARQLGYGVQKAQPARVENDQLAETGVHPAIEARFAQLEKALDTLIQRYSPDQPRDDHGRFTTGFGSLPAIPDGLEAQGERIDIAKKAEAIGVTTAELKKAAEGAAQRVIAEGKLAIQVSAPEAKRMLRPNQDYVAQAFHGEGAGTADNRGRTARRDFEEEVFGIPHDDRTTPAPPTATSSRRGSSRPRPCWSTARTP
jgi:hypothetical protein